jgi:ABC-2 type transport system ATP-binding protein
LEGLRLIVCEHLTRYYGGYAAVNNFTVTIPRGAVCGLVGPNGAGKSTLLRMLSTLLPPSFGRATVGGFDAVENPSDVRRIIGYLPEAFQMYEDMTVERYLLFFARLYDLDPEGASALITDYLERLGLADKKQAKVGALSRGMKQRLGVAKSFLHSPDVVFLDEPASGLDPIARAGLRDFLRWQQHLEKTVLVSSHVLRELADFCDHILILSKGRLAEFGRLTGTDGLMAKYAREASGGSGRRWKLRVVRDAARLKNFLGERPELSNVQVLEQSAQFDFPGDDEAAAKLLAATTAAGFWVTHFAAEEIDLEHVYRKAGGESDQ